MKKLILFVLAFFFASRIKDEKRRGIARSLLTLGAARALPASRAMPLAAWFYNRRNAMPRHQSYAWARSAMPPR